MPSDRNEKPDARDANGDREEVARTKAAPLGAATKNRFSDEFYTLSPREPEPREETIYVPFPKAG